MEVQERIKDALGDVTLGPECAECPGLVDLTCPAARLVIKIEAARESAPLGRVGTGYPYSDDALLQSIEDFTSAVLCCPGAENMGYFAVKSVPAGNDGARFHMIDLATRGMAMWASIEPAVVYLPLPSRATCEEEAEDRAERRAIHG